MRKRLGLLSVAVALMAGITVVAAPAAHASHCSLPYNIKDPDPPDPAAYGFVAIDGLNVSVNPDAAPGYARAVVDYLSRGAGWAECELAPVGTTLCVASTVDGIASSFRPTDFYFRYVYQNSSGGWTLAGNQVTADTEAVRSCLTQT